MPFGTEMTDPVQTRSKIVGRRCYTTREFRMTTGGPELTVIGTKLDSKLLALVGWNAVQSASVSLYQPLRNGSAHLCPTAAGQGSTMDSSFG